MSEEITLPIPEGMSKEDFQEAIAAMAKQGAKKVNSEKPHSEPKTFKVIEKSPNIQIHIYTDVYKGKEINSIREYWMAEDGESFVPTKKGVTYNYEAIDEIIEALQEQKAHLEEAKEEEPEPEV